MGLIIVLQEAWVHGGAPRLAMSTMDRARAHAVDGKEPELMGLSHSDSTWPCLFCDVVILQRPQWYCDKRSVTLVMCRTSQRYECGMGIAWHVSSAT
jgi:hypothetical protein